MTPYQARVLQNKAIAAQWKVAWAADRESDRLGTTEAFNQAHEAWREFRRVAKGREVALPVMQAVEGCLRVQQADAPIFEATMGI